MDLGEFWNGIFASLWIGAQLLFWLAVAAGAATLSFAVIVGCWRGVKSWFKPKAPKSVKAYRQMLEQAELQAAARNEALLYQEGFVDGAQWWYLQDR